MNFNFSTTIPATANNPSNDQPTMLTNNVSDAGIWNIDHYGYNNNLGGWHNVIHIPQITGNANPTPTTTPALAGQVYARTISGDLELFYESPLGIVSQLTAAGITPSPGVNGYSYLPGGIIIQWGVVASTALSGTANFNIPFPNQCFNIQLTTVTSAVSNHANGIYIVGAVTSSNTFFTWNQADPATAQTGFLWLAIGN